MNSKSIPVVDLFAGPGGLGEGFATARAVSGRSFFRVSLSIEMDANAHSTLELRSFFRQFDAGLVPDEYYAHLRQELSRQDLFSAYPREAESARREAWMAELGKVPMTELHQRIDSAVGGARHWVLCGGPPCQAYSIVGRSRRGGIDHLDSRLYLYKEYLEILAKHSPSIFILENVKGLLSSQVNGTAIFRQMLEDLSDPSHAIGKKVASAQYRIVPFVRQSPPARAGSETAIDPREYLIKCEDFGVPQSRHRVFLLGIRRDLESAQIPALVHAHGKVPIARVLEGLPPLRSGLTKAEDSRASWLEALRNLDSRMLRGLPRQYHAKIIEAVAESVYRAENCVRDRGGEFVPSPATINYRSGWFLDRRLKGVCNHASRPHMASDLRRYLFAACYAKITQRSPELGDFPKGLLPDHRNVLDEDKQRYFDDRFRVQLSHQPATTITCHIAKDGHYYIHYDPSQCRSLTVREVARLQTFPDNYFFCGTRTAQYRQVGNAVPPLLARQIAKIVFKILGSC